MQDRLYNLVTLVLFTILIASTVEYSGIFIAIFWIIDTIVSMKQLKLELAKTE